MRITNQSTGLRGVHSVAGLVWIEPGQTIDVEVSDAEAPGILAHPDLLVEAVAQVSDAEAPKGKKV